MAKKMEWYLAVREDGPDLAARVYDMLRYDSCYPMANAPRGWSVFRKPYREGMKGEFTLARWASFGFRTPIVARAVEGSGLPSDLLLAIDKADHARAEGRTIYGGRESYEAVTGKDFDTRTKMRPDGSPVR